ncbi:MAG: 4Fe-4S dicluster domain-containing protein [Chloroflexi bacterium]|nr:4Fe-4S dicluster domain-containing protein [Chloroflexota bacterium]
MTRLGMVIDLKRCIGCHACTMACKAENGTPRGVFFTRVLDKEEGTYPNLKKAFIPVICNHCVNAPCERVCPTGATSKRADGIVLVDHSVCVGCRACYVACPYNNRFFLAKGSLSKGYYDGAMTPFEEVKYKKWQEGTVAKCTFCVERVDQGLDPACVNTCPTEARVFGDLDDPDSKVSRLLRQRKGVQALPECDTDPSVYYLWG